MLYPPVANLLKNVQSRYLLVNVVAQRARQIAEEAAGCGFDLYYTAFRGRIGAPSAQPWRYLGRADWNAAEPGTMGNGARSAL